MKMICIFLILLTFNSCPIFAQIEKNSDYIKEVKNLDSISDEQFYKELEKSNQKFWEFYIKNYAKAHNLPVSAFPKEIPAEITLRLKGVPISQLKEMIKDPKSVKEAEKQYQDILDGIRTKKWKPFSEQEWIQSQSGYKKPADQKEIESKIESSSEEKIEIKTEEDKYSFFKQPWFIALAAFLLFIFGMLIFKKGS